MKILGISAFYHDSAAAILIDGQVVCAVQEERFSRIKYDACFPEQAIRYCLEETGMKLPELDAVVFYDKPFLKFERILETYFATAPLGFPSFLRSMPLWIKEKLFIKQRLKKELKKIAGKKAQLPPFYFPEHHLSHAASAYYPSGFEHALILTVDGVGEYTTTSICKGEGNSITRLKTIDFPDSLGLFYAAFTYYLGFRVNSGEYKLMGLSSYGDSSSAQFREYYDKITNHLIDIREDGSFHMHQSFFRFRTGLRMTNNRQWKKLFGFPRRNHNEPIEKHHQDLALAAQKVTEEILLKMVKEGQRLTQARKLCLAGGVALNCVANGKLLQSGLFDQIYVQPAAGDAGGAVGAALAFYFLSHPEKEKTNIMPHAYLGPAPKTPGNWPSSLQISTFEKEEDLFKKVASLLTEGNVLGWVQGRMEFGPRALGNRSILADPRQPEMKDRINRIIKEREGFRPFAPVVLEEEASQYFEMNGSASPFMLFTYPVKSKDIPAVTHMDSSARVQTVNTDQNEKLVNLLRAFKARTGCPVLLNTSFNGKEEPIVCTTEDAVNCFLKTGLDYLLIENTLIQRK
jgi:carbamoyltransferase